MTYEVSHIIHGKKVPFDQTETILPIHNPALGEVIGHVNMGGEAVCHLAIESAYNAGFSWSKSTLSQRAQILFRFRSLMEKHQQELAIAITREHGKTIDDALGSIARGIEIVEYHCGLLTGLQGVFSPEVSLGIDTYTIKQPVGVCVGISPFNFPVMVPLWMMIPAIACGNTYVIKPSEQTPSAPVKLIELLSEAGLPDGVVNCVHGGKSTVETLITHPNVSAVTAVASSVVAKSIYTQAVMHGKRAHTFGGAKNHCVVMPNADIKLAAKAIVGAAFGSAGERCMAISVVVAVQGIADQLVQELSSLTKAIKIGKGDEKNCEMGPVISQAHLERIRGYIEQGVQEGATLYVDGRLCSLIDYSQGFFIGPSIFDHVAEHMSIYQHEIFGPVLCVMRVASLEEAIELINRNQYGNGCAIFTKDGYQARYFSQTVQVGMVGINIPLPVPVNSHPFGGWKHSSFGDTNMHGLESIHFYTKRKTVVCKWPNNSQVSDAFIMTSHRG